MKISLALTYLFILFMNNLVAQNKALVNTSKSSYAKLGSIDMGSVHWTTGFWADRFRVCRDSMVPNMWQLYTSSVSNSFKNFEVAAGLDTGRFRGPSFHDGDFYKTLEAVASMYSATKDKKLDELMDKAIAVIGKAQRADGYIYTKAIIEQKKTGVSKQFEDRLSFEAYNFGHLMTAACVHYRATGKTSLLNIAKKATDYLDQFYKMVSPELAGNAICPSHYMGVIEMYRTIHEPKYLQLAKHLIDIKGGLPDGQVDNQDRLPFRKQTKTMGHAVRANYLFAGAADIFAETGDTSLSNTLDRMWKDLTQHKMYITGGCGSVYDGVSDDGTSYNPADVQKIHQAYGRDYQLPNFTAHNETCANIGNLLWNYRMLQLSGEAKYADIMELALYNSILSGISLDGKKFLYTNPLAYSDELPFQQRWSKDRVPYISKSNCCPPNVVRTIAEVSNYVYSVSEKGLWINLYGGNNLSTKIEDGSALKLNQQTNYPWDGNIKITLEEVPGKPFSFFLRIPGWASNAKILINGKPYNAKAIPGQYAEIKNTWKKNDNIELILPMEAKLIEANPLVEETRNQVAVKRGPVVYCLESIDLPKDKNVFRLSIPVDTKFKTKKIWIENSEVMSLEGMAKVIDTDQWKNKLYKEVSEPNSVPVPVTLIPYYAWGNRGHTEMSVWLPVSR